jgi:excinuclease ABC subunit A
VDKVQGVPAAIAIDQTNPVRSSRSTVGTMTELNDHLKLLFARLAQLYDQQTALPVLHDSGETIYAQIVEKATTSNPRLVVTFPVELPGNTTPEEIEQWLSASGFTRVQAEREVATPAGPRKVLDVVADRFKIESAEKVRVMEAIELALKRGSGRMNVYAGDEAAPEIWKFSTGLHCPESDIRYAQPTPSLFSFHLQRLWPRDWGGLWAGDAGWPAYLARWCCQAISNPCMARVSRRFDAPCRARRHSARYRMEQAHA